MRVNHFSGIDDPDMPSLCVNPLSPTARCLAAVYITHTNPRDIEFLLNPAGEEAVFGGPSTSTDDDADVDDSVPTLLYLCQAGFAVVNQQYCTARFRAFCTSVSPPPDKSGRFLLKRHLKLLIFPRFLNIKSV